MATNRSPFFINNYMVVLIILNIILIIAVVFLASYLIKNKKDDAENVCVNYDEDDDEEIEKIKYIQKKEPKSERVFVGRFITDEEYQQILKNVIKQSDISILLEDIKKEYEKLKELNNEGTERNNTR